MSEKSINPSFEDPPLKEVSFLAQFDPIPGFHVGMLGLLWNEFRKEYPHFEEAAPLVGDIEKFGLLPPRRELQFQLLGKPDAPRVFYIIPCGQWLIQVQADRFGLNWRITEEGQEPYPRYETTSARFIKEFETFKRFLKTHELNFTTVLQLELTYINHIEANGNDPHIYFNDVHQPSRFPPDLSQEALTVSLQHTVTENGKKIGRLYTSIVKTFSQKTGKEGYQLQFTAKAFPNSQEISSISSRLLAMRDHINHCFVNMTTKEMHTEWGLQEK